MESTNSDSSVAQVKMDNAPTTMKSVFRPFPLPLTGRQWFYLTFLQGVGAGCIDGGANFGIAYAMYHGQDVVKMWVFKDNTIAGDLGVTPIIQCLASMLITSTLVHSDLHASSIKPLPYVYPHVEHLPDPRLLLSPSFRKEHKERQQQLQIHEKGSHAVVEQKGFKYYYWMLVRFIFEGTERNMLLAKPGFANWWGRFIWTAAQGAAIGIIFGFPIWCLAVVILGPIYGNGNMGNKWAPQVIKLVYGAIVGWVTNPVIAVLALGSQADHHLIIVENQEDEEATIAERNTGAVRPITETIQEEGEHRTNSSSTAGTVPDSPVSRSPLVRPTIPKTPTNATNGRPRATSTLSTSSFQLRPPLTANVSRLSPRQPSADLAEPETLDRPRYRERGLTVSSIGSNYSYALSATGGRAQRPRAGTATSSSALPVIGKTEDGMPEVMVTRPSQDLDSFADDNGEGRPRAGSCKRTTSGVPASPGSSPVRPTTRLRSPSSLQPLGEVVETRRE